MRGRNSRCMGPRRCEVCHASFTPTRSGHTTCSATCRSRKMRGTYVVTDEDRAAIDRVFARAAHELPPMPTPEEVRAHILATVTRE